MRSIAFFDPLGACICVDRIVTMISATATIRAMLDTAETDLLTEAGATPLPAAMAPASGVWRRVDCWLTGVARGLERLFGAPGPGGG
jgi:hypothetical protein